MTTDLTGHKISDTYNQLLHVDGGFEFADPNQFPPPPSYEPKTVYTGNGYPTALKVGPREVVAGGFVLDTGNTITTTTGGDIFIVVNRDDNNITPVGVFIDGIRIEKNSIFSASGLLEVNYGRPTIVNNLLFDYGDVITHVRPGEGFGLKTVNANLDLNDLYIRDNLLDSTNDTLKLGQGSTHVYIDDIHVQANKILNSVIFDSPPTTPGNPLLRGENVDLGDNVDLDFVIDTGFYELGQNPINGPNSGSGSGSGSYLSFDDAQLIVSRGRRSVAQIICASYEMWMRVGFGITPNYVQTWFGWHKLNNSLIYESGLISINNGSTLSVPHTLGRIPQDYQCILRCVYDDVGYNYGHEIYVSSAFGVSTWATDTAIFIETDANGVYVRDASTGNLVQINNGSWRYIVRIYG